MKTRDLIWFAVLFLFGTFAANAPGETIKLSDGTKLTFAGITQGKLHITPGFENARYPNPYYLRDGGSVVWIKAEHEPGKWPSFELLVSDKADTACVALGKSTSTHVTNGVDMYGFVLNAFPRWDKETILRARPYRGEIGEGHLVITNPELDSIADWTPEPMPVTKSDGDFEVTLTNLIAGVPLPHWPNKPAPKDDPANQCVRLAFGFQQNGHSVTNWRPWLARTSDAASNHVQGVIYQYPENGIFDYHPQEIPILKTDGYYERGLWPGKSPWKVRLEFTQTCDFSDEEMLILTNLPVRAGTEQEWEDQWSWDGKKTNFTFTTATVNGVQVKVLEPLLTPDKINSGQKIDVIIFADNSPTLQGKQLTIIQATDERGQPLSTPFSPAWAGHFDVEILRPPDTKTLNLKLALHKSRFVEFTVKPSKQ